METERHGTAVPFPVFVKWNGTAFPFCVTETKFFFYSYCTCTGFCTSLYLGACPLKHCLWLYIGLSTDTDTDSISLPNPKLLN